MSVHTSTGGGRYHHPTDREIPLPRFRQGRQYPLPRSKQEGTLPRSRQGGTPFQVQVGGIPSQVRVGGYPFPGWRYPSPTWEESTPHPGQIPGWGEGYPLPEQRSVYLLRGGRCASCFHAGGLSCDIIL